MIITRYRFENKLYTLEELRRLDNFRNILFSSNPSEKELKFLNIDKEDIEVPIEDGDPSKSVSLNDMKNRKRKEIDERLHKKFKDLDKEYSIYEINTFEEQYRGALDIMDRNPHTDNAKFVIDLYCSRNNIDDVSGNDKLKDYCKKIIQKNNIRKNKISHLIGVYKNLNDQIDNASDYNTLNNIAWNE